jgi:hypothetical protein
VVEGLLDEQKNGDGGLARQGGVGEVVERLHCGGADSSRSPATLQESSKRCRNGGGR